MALLDVMNMHFICINLDTNKVVEMGAGLAVAAIQTQLEWDNSSKV
jgi:hypothetical protein